jgi:hypothetical protein
MDILEIIAAFRRALQDAETVAEFEALRAWVGKVEAALGIDRRVSAGEKQLLVSLAAAVGTAIFALDQNRYPDKGRISAALTGLQHSIERRTTGPDGWPLRK